MKTCLLIIILAICSSCETVRETHTVVSKDTLVVKERVVVIDSIYSRNDTIYHRTHEMVDNYIYSTKNSNDTIYIREEQQGVKKQSKSSNTAWYIVVVVVLLILIGYAIRRKK